jgi:hypothetical protein
MATASSSSIFLEAGPINKSKEQSLREGKYWGQIAPRTPSALVAQIHDESVMQGVRTQVWLREFEGNLRDTDRILSNGARLEENQERRLRHV